MPGSGVTCTQSTPNTHEIRCVGWSMNPVRLNDVASVNSKNRANTILVTPVTLYGPSARSNNCMLSVARTLCSAKRFVAEFHSPPASARAA